MPDQGPLMQQERAREPRTLRVLRVRSLTMGQQPIESELNRRCEPLPEVTPLLASGAHQLHQKIERWAKPENRGGRAVNALPN